MIHIYKCGLGCGQLIHDIDEHIDFAHADRRQDFPVSQIPRTEYENKSDYWDKYYAISDKRASFIEDNFKRLKFEFTSSLT